MTQFNEKYKGKTIQGSHFPDAPIRDNVKITFSDEILSLYIPTMDQITAPKGIKLLCLIMADHEGFWGKGPKHRSASRSFRTNNPGNIGNTDNGSNNSFPTLKAGIEAQINYFYKIINGSAKAFPIGKKVTLKPYFSQEIADNYATYKMNPYLPGYTFTFTGQLDQFIKIYSTGARAGNSYLSEIISFYKNHGYSINGQTTLKELSELK
jgi:hypothetical protein